MQGLSFPRSAWGCRPGRSASAFVPAQKRRRASKTAFPRRAWERGKTRLTQVNRCISWIFMGFREPSAIHESSFRPGAEDQAGENFLALAMFFILALARWRANLGKITQTNSFPRSAWECRLRRSASFLRACRIIWCAHEPDG